MSVQTSYTNATPRGIAGGLYDLSNHMVDSRRYHDTTRLQFGTGVVIGENPGEDVAKPSSDDQPLFPLSGQKCLYEKE